MTIWEAVRASLQSIAAHRLRTALSGLGVAIGVAAVMMLVALGEGARNYIEDQFDQIGANLIQVTPGRIQTGGGPPMPATTDPLTLQDAIAVRRYCPSVSAVMPILVGSARIETPERARTTFVIGTSSDFPDMRNIRPVQGSFLPDEDWERGSRVCVLGWKAARELFRGGRPLDRLVRVGDGRFRVIGVMEEKGRQFGFDIDDVAYVPVSQAMRIFNKDDLSEMGAKATSDDTLETAKDEIRAVLMDRHDGEEDFTIVDQSQMLETLQQLIGVVTAVVGAIAAISLVVGGVGIMNIMLVTVAERTSEIGLRKAVGARRRDLLLQFLTESALLSCVGGAAGLAVGWGVVGAADLALPAFNPTVPTWAVVMAVGVSVVTGVVSGVSPAMRAAAMDPVEALRIEG